MATKKLWQTDGSKKLHPEIERYTTGDDTHFDGFIIGYDALATTAHTYMLTRQGYLTAGEFQKVKVELKKIFDRAVQGPIEIPLEMEDGHTALENWLTEKIGELGGKIHLSRSRNDQSATAVRLFAKDELIQIRQALLTVIDLLLRLAKKHKQVPMPGYTHTRPAMPSSLGHYFAAYAETLTDDYRSILAAYELTDSNPLGSAAGYGTTVPIDRLLTTKLLGFSRLHINTLSTQLSRGKISAAILGALSNVSLTLSRFAHDLINFSAPEYDFFSFDDSVTTGSSIMPQKRNPDPLEIMRGVAGVILGYQVQVSMIVKGLPAGYQRDLQLTKQPMVEGLKIAKRSLRALAVILDNLRINATTLTRAASNPHLFAANLANELVLEKKLSFREAYRQVKESYQHAAFRTTVTFDDVPSFDPVANIARTAGHGMPGNLYLAQNEQYVRAARTKATADQKKFKKITQDIWKL